MPVAPTDSEEFLPEHPRAVSVARMAAPAGYRPTRCLFGDGQLALEVMLVDATAPPTAAPLRRLWKDRFGGRGNPLLVVALHGGQAWLCGPAGDAPGIYEMAAGDAEKRCARALEEPDRNAALRYLKDALPAAITDTGLPGFRNEGLLTNHVMRHFHDSFGDVTQAAAHGAGLERARDRELLRRLGFEIERKNSNTDVLRVAGQKRAIAILLARDELEEVGSGRFQGAAPIAHALAEADSENLPWVVTVQADRVRLYPRALGHGVGRRGRTDTFLEARTDLVRQDQLALLWLCFSAAALAEAGSLETLLEDSKKFAHGLATRLRERIYDEVVPGLATGIARARGIARPGPEELRQTYAMALTTLFRLLFIAYAEDREFLPIGNSAYQLVALKTRAQAMLDNPTAPRAGDELWQDVNRLFGGIRDGRPDWGLPAYGGGLFADDSPTGAALAALSLPDAVFAPALRALLIEPPPDLASPGGLVDFRSLRVREFGTIYEGLLESELALAESDLALRRQGKANVYVPARPGEAVAVPAGTVYLHNRSGARKTSGSYYTPGFAVDHLLDAALAPALQAHAARVAGLTDAVDAAAAFFDFRIADIAMGSGHFLVAAMDRVEQAFAAMLLARPLPGVQAELDTLREAAHGALGAMAQTTPIAPAQLLRRLIAMRCIYGVDLNPLAVDLARLSIWIHGFVPGLPLAMLEGRLRHGNALVGVATVRQLEERFAASGMALFPVDAKSLLGDAEEPLRRRAKLADVTPKDVAQAREEMRLAELVLGPTKALCDIVVAQRVAPKEVPFQFENWVKERPRIQKHPSLAKARKVLAGLDVLHFPVAFPEVFLSARPGFDVILGNPPWEKVKVEEHAFWGRHFPGLRGLEARAREAAMPGLRAERPDLVAALAAEVAANDALRAVLAGGFDGMGSGDPDLYKAFAWRFWHLAAERGGRIGVVLPRSVMAGLGTELLRRTMFGGAESVEVVTVTNKGGWVFEEVHPQFTIALLAVARGTPGPQSVALRGPYAGMAQWEAARGRAPQRFGTEAVLGWTSSASLPMLPREESAAVFAKMREAPRLDARIEGEWRARPDTELHATADKGLMLFEPGAVAGLWPVFKGESFDTWQNDRGPGSYYAWAKPAVVREHLFAKRLRSGSRGTGSVFGEFTGENLRDKTTLYCERARIAFRDVSRATDSRTIRAALIPPRVFLTHKAPFMLWPSGDEQDEAFLVGCLGSIALDWYARRFVEVSLTYFILNPFPIPRPPRTNPQWQRAVTLAGRLAAPDERFVTWAGAVGVPYGSLDALEKRSMIEELDATIARLYGLTPDQLRHIFETFHDWPTPAQRAEWNARAERTVAILIGL